MIISSHFIQFLNFVILLLRYSKFFTRISDSFKFQKFWTHCVKVMAKKTIKSILQLSSIYTSGKANDIVAAEGYFILDRKLSIKL